MSDHVSSHEHEVSAEYLYSSDAEVLGIYEEAGQLTVEVATVCPECSETLALTAPVESIADSAVDLPLAEDYYD